MFISFSNIEYQVEEGNTPFIKTIKNGMRGKKVEINRIYQKSLNPENLPRAEEE
ncbi:MAG: hypothetical protein QXQ50_10235 [Candidatus Bathyarchaeia archaeon]